jgi:hypothetical protein
MALENLKSAFSGLVKTSEVEGRHGESPTTNTPFLPKSIFEATTYAWNSIVDEPINPEGGMEAFDSPLLSDLYNNPDTTTTLNNPSSDTRFQVGIGFPSPNTKLIMSGDGYQASLAYIQSATGNMFVASGAVTKLGKVTDVLSKIGIDTPNFDFGASLDSAFPSDPVPTFLTYQNQVEERFNPNGGNLTNEFVNTGNSDSTRGIAFQVLGDVNQSGIGQDFRFQDKVVNEKMVNYISPISSFTPGNIEFKDDYFLDIGQSLGALGSALTPDIDFPDFNLDLRGIGGLKFLSEDSKIRDMFNGLGGIFGELGGFGKRLDLPKFPKLDIDFGAIGDFFSGGGISNPFSGVTNPFSGMTNPLSGLGDLVGTIRAVGGPIAQSFKELKSNLNPLDELKLPQIGLQNPRQVSVTDYGGQAIFRANAPRSLTRNIPMRTTAPSETADKAYVENDISTPYSQLGNKRYAGVGELGKLRAPSSYYPNSSMDEKACGDKMTLADIKGPTLSEYDDGAANWVDSEKNGMPFFFKDLRNNNYIIFRGYVSGIGDTYAPGWSEQSYIGRSEKNYVYQGSDRSISLTFKLAAQTATELDSIYYKLNKLTGLVYPEYMSDHFLMTGKQTSANGQILPSFKTRMKPPLARMRVGDLFGNPQGKTRDGLLGFMDSLSYAFPDESPWETRHGQRVPKVIDVTINWKVIHEQVPDWQYPEFYGYNPARKQAREKLDNKSSTPAAELASQGG